ncbi:hypothetical protein HAX54_007451 [Datura stramonium]|uniref:Uncharacterized protein n=1 Tax=Datura stramonium TaxID=4076 RepID=A0ABS8WXU6_DATST|nr:hypothetical protein [Datura stramonium]
MAQFHIQGTRPFALGQARGRSKIGATGHAIGYRSGTRKGTRRPSSPRDGRGAAGLVPARWQACSSTLPTLCGVRAALDVVMGGATWQGGAQHALSQRVDRRATTVSRCDGACDEALDAAVVGETRQGGFNHRKWISHFN